MVDIIHLGIGVDKFNEILDNLDDIFLGKHTYIHICMEVQLVVDTVTTYFTQVITLITEEQIIDYLTCACIIGRICISQLSVDKEHSFLFAVGNILLQSVEDGGIVRRTSIFLSRVLVKQYRGHVAVQNQLNGIVIDDGLTVENHFIALDRNHLTGILIHEVLYPTLQYPGCQLTTGILLQTVTGDLDFLCKSEDFQNILIRLESDGTEKGGHWQLLLTVDVSIHHIVDVSSELYPATLERYDSGRI